MKIVNKGKILCINNKYKLIYLAGKLIVVSIETERIIFKYNLFGKKLSVLSRIRIMERMLRLEARCAVSVTEDVFLVSCYGQILRINVAEKSVYVEHQYKSDMNNPLGFCVRNNGDDVEVIYGEYGWNSNKEEVGIWQRDNGQWKQIYEFPKETITHIHQIIYDPYRGEYLIATGDEDRESGIWRADINFSKIEPILLGSQQYRSCSVFPTRDGFIYATDTPLTQNYLYMYSYEEKESRIISEMPAPCIYAKNVGTAYYFATSVEPDSTLKKWNYRFTYKLGKGVSDRYTHILCYQHGKLNEICKLKKDWLPIWLFQFGNCQFSMIQNETTDVYFIPTAVKYDNRTMQI